MFGKIGRTLREYRSEHHANFTGLVHVSVPDMQCMSDVTAERDSVRYRKPVGRRRMISHGSQSRMFGVRVVAHKDVPRGTVELDRQ
jgi:hypothetical protein